MANLDALLSDLANFDAQQNLGGLRQVREQIIAEFPDSDAAVEALYKVGLDHLFRQRNLAVAVEKFEAAGKRKHPYWSAAARTSLGLCYYHQKRKQKALFELRKVAYPERPTPHSVTALAFIENIFAMEGNAEEIKRARKDRIHQLEQLVAGARGAGNAAERGYYLYSLGVALKDHGDDERAKSVLGEAKALGPQALGAELFRSVAELLTP